MLTQYLGNMNLQTIFAQTEELDELLTKQEMAELKGGIADRDREGCRNGRRCSEGSLCSAGKRCKNGGRGISQAEIQAEVNAWG